MRTHSAYRVMFCALLLFVLIPATVLFSDARTSVTVGLEQNPPICFMDNGTAKGISVDVLEEAARREGWEITWKPCRWEECLEHLTNGKLDLLIGIGHTKERENLYDFNTEPVVINWGQLYAAKTVRISSLLELEGKRVALVPTDLHGAAFQDTLNRFGIYARIIAVPSYGAGIKAVLDGHADACVVSRIYPLKRTEASRIDLTPIIFNPAQNKYATRKGRNKELLHAIDRHLVAMKSDKESLYFRSLDSWLAMPGKSKIPDWVWWALSIGGLLLAMFAFSNIVCRKRIKARTFELEQEIAVRRRTEEALHQAQRLELIGQLTAGVAHEVRNPLNAILMNTEALFREKEVEEKPEFAPYLLHIRTQVKRLSHLMNDLLDLGRSLPAETLLPIKPFDVCRDAITLQQGSINGTIRTIALDVASNAQDCWITGDSERLLQILVNLLDNACQHSPDSSIVTLRLARIADQMLSIQVIDQGAGIPSEKLPNVFEPFYSGRRGGTGLGLALVQHFTRMMGGTVSIANNTPLPGCTAEVRLPLCAP